MIEARFKEAIDRWVKSACPMGNFITAVLENDLKLAIAYADDSAVANLKQIVIYLYNDVPSGCWGSKEKVSKWKGLNKPTIQPDDQVWSPEMAG